MTINGAITELQLLLKASDMPTYYKPCIKKIIETIQMELVYQMSRLDELEHRIEMHEKAMAKVADTPQTEMDKCYKCKWWNYSYGCSNKKGICDFEQADTPQTDCIIADAKLKAHCLNCVESGSYKCTKCDGEMYYKDTPQTEEVIK